MLLYNFKKITNILLVILLILIISSLDHIYAKSEPTNTEDFTEPQIDVISPFNGEVVTESAITVNFLVSDQSDIKEVIVNGESLPASLTGEYFFDFSLFPGENFISIIAIDINNNIAFVDLSVGFLSFDDLENIENELEESIEELEAIIELTDQLIEELEEKEVISFTEELVDLSEAILKEFLALAEGLEEIIDIAQTVSIEIVNAPLIPEGDEALFDFPEIEELELFEELEDTFEIPKGFSFATDISFQGAVEPTEISNQDLSKESVAVLVDARGRTFVVGFAFLREVNPELFDFRNTLKKNYKFQTTNGTPLELTTTITVPADATEGDAKVSILNKNQSLATIPFRVVSPSDVKIGKRTIGKPQINDPIIATVKKSGKKLILNITGKNFIQKIATIDGKLQKLLGKASFTNVTFVPSEGIKVKSVKARKNSVKVIAELTSEIEPGIKLFNVITPKGADIGAIVLPEDVTDGTLETTTKPEELIINSL